MSGHSKWSKIKNQKAVTDIKKGKAFSLLARSITQSVREGKSGNPDDNPRLRMILKRPEKLIYQKKMFRGRLTEAWERGAEELWLTWLLKDMGRLGWGLWPPPLPIIQTEPRRS